ncbi:MAG: PEP-CTERM sorting domain-containing protein [Planctomycetes bacterium]|nr:PEP-CTERM sorting domain-containing protein [Planctomycetota bacterium]
MKKHAVLVCIILTAIASPVFSASYFGYDQWGGMWSDVEKSPVTGDDDQMCWAASAAGVLHWTGWAQVAGFDDADQTFDYLLEHWTNAGGLMRYAWQWWFDGQNPTQYWDGWSVVNVAGGAFLAGQYDFSEYFYRGQSDALAMSAIDEYLHAGYGVAAALTSGGHSHTIVVWGYEYDDDGYAGIWATSSDDDKYAEDPPDRLRYFAVSPSNGRWYLQDPTGGATWYINEVQALDRNPAQLAVQAPEPASITLFGIVAAVSLFRRRR